MSRISNAFAKGRKALIAYVTTGYPSLEATVEVVPMLARLGCDIVELGIPFSDPLADGATIQEASLKALHNGATADACLSAAAKIRRVTDVPLVFMSYFNPILASGLSSFVERSSQSGLDGLIVPDLPPEEGGELESLARPKGIDLIYLLAPTSTEVRIRVVASHSRGFIYLVSVAGVTGARTSLPPDLEVFVKRVRVAAKQPLCVGFGISTPPQAREVARYADGVIVGSRLVRAMESPDWRIEVEKLITGFRLALDAPPSG